MKEEQLTPFQESCLHVLFLFEERLRRERDINERKTCMVQVAFFREVLGTKIQAYHRRKIDQLVEFGWLERYKSANSAVFYNLTSTGRLALAGHMSLARRHAYLVNRHTELLLS